MYEYRLTSQKFVAMDRIVIIIWTIDCYLTNACMPHSASLSLMHLASTPMTYNVVFLRLTHPSLNKMATISQMMFSDEFSWITTFVFWLKNHLFFP